MARRSGCRLIAQRVMLRAAVGFLLSPALALPAASAADAPPGRVLFTRNCGTCHTVSATPVQRQGPNLFGIVGRPAGKLQGFKYSKALAKVQFVWTKERLDAWLTDSAKLVPGTIMNYRQADPATRAGIIEYLEAARTAEQ